MNTAIIGRIDGEYHTLAAWDTYHLMSRENRMKVLQNRISISNEYPEIPIFYYIISKKILLLGETFAISEWDNFVISFETLFNKNEQNWNQIKTTKLITAQTQARKELGF